MNVIIQSGHATRRMSQRGITRADIERALQTCFLDRTGDDGPGTAHLGYGMNNDELKVWTLAYTDHNGTLTVKSAAWKGR